MNTPVSQSVIDQIVTATSRRYGQLMNRTNGRGPVDYSLILLEEVKGHGFRESNEISEVRSLVSKRRAELKKARRGRATRQGRT